jgi:hypothetical protein
MVPCYHFVLSPHVFFQCCGAASYAAPAPGKNFDAVPAAAAPATTLLNSKAKFLKRTKVYTNVEISCSFYSIRFISLKI